jgi:hypothetical protein
MTEQETIAEYLASNPLAQVDEIAFGTGLNEDVVRTILDEWRPTEDGFEYMGPGAGGPWVIPA